MWQKLILWKHKLLNQQSSGSTHNKNRLPAVKQKYEFGKFIFYIFGDLDDLSTGLVFICNFITNFNFIQPGNGGAIR